MEDTIPYTDQTSGDVPFIYFLLQMNPPIGVSSVYIGKRPLLSENNNQMYLIKLEMLKEMFGTKIYPID